MTKTKKTKNGRRINTFVKNGEYTLSFSRPAPGVKDSLSTLNVSGINPETGELSRVKLDGRAVAQLRRVLLT